MKNFIFYLLTATVAIVLMAGCNERVGPTAVTVEDSSRHYHPVIIGEKVNMSYKIRNIGNTPLVINDIQPSCGCIMKAQREQRIIFPGDSDILQFTFNATNNLGYVRHVIRIYANVKPHGEIDLIFDLDIVPKESESHDFEQVYEQSVLNGASADSKDDPDKAVEKNEYWVDKPQFKSHKSR